MTTLYDILDAIENGSADENLRSVMEVARSREKLIAERNARQLVIGSRVRLGGIRPQALNGAFGTVMGLNRTTVSVKIDPEFAYSAGRFSHSIERGSPLRVPKTCISAIVE